MRNAMQAETRRRGSAPDAGKDLVGKAEARGKKAESKKEKVEESSVIEPQSASGDASLSIQDTNKLRAKLGLKPLEMNENKKELGTKEEPLVAETINPIHIKKQKEMREKLAALKEKRIRNQKLGKVKTLAEDDWLDDTTAWVEKNRKAEKEKELAAKRAQLLEEMDQEEEIWTKEKRCIFISGSQRT